MKSYTLPVQYDPATHDYFLQFPDEALLELGWNIGDTLEWIDNKDGSFTVKKKEEKPKEG